MPEKDILDSFHTLFSYFNTDKCPKRTTFTESCVINPSLYVSLLYVNLCAGFVLCKWGVHPISSRLAKNSRPC